MRSKSTTLWWVQLTKEAGDRVKFISRMSATYGLVPPYLVS